MKKLQNDVCKVDFKFIGMGKDNKMKKLFVKKEDGDITHIVGIFIVVIVMVLIATIASGYNYNTLWNTVMTGITNVINKVMGYFA
ncbi:hypothetical protein [Clostridium akagii]|uniref:hypothetical protein n=1 Tax=Clostridium akagii TaxID=91623 RepID=UPI00047E95AC|nr:hypothetical protein [Clostridium akagii]